MNYSRHELTSSSHDAGTAPGSGAEAVVAVVPRAMRQIRSVARSAAGGLTVPQFRALRFVNRHPGTGLTPLAEHLGVSLPAASALVGRLVASAFVGRELDPVERRRIAIHLTDGGRERIETSTSAVHAWWDRRLRDLAPADRDALLAGLAVLDAVLSDPDALDDAAPAAVVA